MARKPRIEFSGALYHVIARGNHRQVIFHDNADFLAYLERLERYRRRDGMTLYAYVLMKNHVHLLLETGDVPLSRMMQTLQFTYTQHYNRRYNKTGHLFEGRYKAILCDRNEYLLELVRYLHLNPARLRHPQNPWRYRWSSYRAYLGERTPVQVETHEVLNLFHRQGGPARQAYLKFMKEGQGLKHEDKYYDVVDQRFLGDEKFLDKIERRVTASPERLPRKGPKVSWPRLLAAVADVTDLDADALVEPGRQRVRVAPRALLVYLAREWNGLSSKELGQKLRRDPSMISRLYHTYIGNRDQRAEERVRHLLEAK